MKKPRVYIAGPMRGLPFYNFPAFDKARDELNQMGFDAVSPADLDRKLYGFEALNLPKDYDWKSNPLPVTADEVLRTDMNVVKTCYAVLLLPGWESSTGAQKEVDTARASGIPIYEHTMSVRSDWSQITPLIDKLWPIPDKVMAKDSKPTNPKDMIGSDKLPLHLWPTTATALGCLGLLDGALKYGRANFRAVGVRTTIYVDACLRHLYKFFEGEDIDPDSGLPHLSHALACLAIIVDAQAAGKLNDDRNIAGGYPALVAELTPHVKRLKEKYQDRHPRHYTIVDGGTQTL